MSAQRGASPVAEREEANTSGGFGGFNFGGIRDTLEAVFGIDQEGSARPTPPPAEGVVTASAQRGGTPTPSATPAVDPAAEPEGSRWNFLDIFTGGNARTGQEPAAEPNTQEPAPAVPSPQPTASPAAPDPRPVPPVAPEPPQEPVQNPEDRSEPASTTTYTPGTDPADRMVGRPYPYAGQNVFIGIKNGFWPRGEEVDAIQYRLIRHGIPVGRDGVYGPETKAAIIAFQQAKNLKVDGVVGPKTWEALFSP